MRCFNCGESLPLSKFLQDQDPALYKEYCLENFKEGIWESKEEYRPVLVAPIKEEAKLAIDHFKGLISYRDIPKGHPAMGYITDRQIPEKRYKELYIVPKFHKWASRIDPIFGKFKTDHPRLVLPYYDINKNLLGFTCRAYGQEQPKYIHLRTDDTREFIYGQDHVDISKPILVVEGQIDSMFLDNCVAIGRASYKSGFLETHKNNLVIIPDNDFRRNIHVCEQIKKAITSGFNVCFLPESWKKDINLIVKSGINAQEIHEYVMSNRKSGAQALLQLALERKC